MSLMLLTLTIPISLVASLETLNIHDYNRSILISPLDYKIWKYTNNKEYTNFYKGSGIIVNIDPDKFEIQLKDFNNNFLKKLYSGNFIPSDNTTILKVGDKISYYSLFNVIYYVSIQEGNEFLLTQNGFSETLNNETENINENVQFYYHNVKKDETLWRLERLYKVDQDLIRKANNIPKNSDLIKIGQILKIPKPNFCFQKTYVEEVPQQEEESAEYFFYKVTSGNTLWDLAGKYRVTVPELQALNDMEESDSLIYAGDSLKIPLKNINHRSINE